ncbi:hypothetical protein TNCV_3010021 [Trichonephila clavipes]|nr:hypothetical protein TNCV_3010021 [Trichonephila clavipes]
MPNWAWTQGLGHKEGLASPRSRLSLNKIKIRIISKVIAFTNFGLYVCCVLSTLKGHSKNRESSMKLRNYAYAYKLDSRITCARTRSNITSSL